MLDVKINSRRRLKARGNVKEAVNLEEIAALRIPEWWLDDYFGPVEYFVEHLQQGGTSDVSASDLSLHYQSAGRLYHPVSGMLSMAEVFKIAQLRDASCPCSENLFLMAEKLGAGKLLAAEEIHDLRGCLRELRAYASSQSRSHMIDLIRTACIKLELRKHDEVSWRPANAEPLRPKE